MRVCIFIYIKFLHKNQASDALPEVSNSMYDKTKYIRHVVLFYAMEHAANK